ncbi:hypothetical protein [Salmonella enterica]|nr:hypothetical protein [Salmonella enterica]
MMSARYAFGDQHDAQSFCLKHYFSKHYLLIFMHNKGKMIALVKYY